MAFSQQELDIIKYGQKAGKSRAEVETALSNFRNGIKPQPAKIVEQKGESLASKLAERATTLGKEALSIGTLGASTISKQDVAEARQNPEQAQLVGLEAFNRAFQSPIRMAGAVAGAGADILGAGLEATGLDKPIAQALQPVVSSDVAQKAISGFKSLPQGTQEVLGDIGNVAGFVPIGAGASAVKSSIPKALNVSALDTIKGSSGKLTSKALDFISADPSAKVETILKRSTPQELDNYLAIAEKSSQSGEAKSVLEAVGDKMAQTTKTLKTKLDGIGAAKSEVMAKNGDIDFTAQTTPLVSQLEDIMKSFTEIDKAQSPIVEKFIADAKNIRTASQADTFIDKAQDALYTGDRTMVLPSGSALEKRLQKIIGEYNSSLKKVVPEEYAKLNEQYAKLVEALSVINKSLGDTFEGVPLRGSGLVKQYFSPAGSKTKEIFEFIKKETGGEVDLAKDATLAKFAGQLYDDANVESLLGGIKDIPTTAGAVVGKVIEKVGGKQVTEALRSSTVKKAKSSTLPAESKATSAVEKKLPTESKSVSSPNTTPTPTKSKGIRGMIDFGAIGRAFTPSEKRTIKEGLRDLKLAKSENGRMEMLKDVKELLIKEKILSRASANNSNIIEEAAWKSLEDSDIVLDTVKKKEMSTPMVKKVNDRFIKNPTTGKLEGSKKLGSKEIYHGTDKKFSMFDLTKRGTNENDFPAKNAFFFTDSIETAKSYGKNIIKKHGNFEKPLTIDADGATYGDFRDELRDAIEKAKREGNDVVIIKNLSDRKDWGNYEPTTHYAVLDINKVSGVGIKKVKINKK